MTASLSRLQTYHGTLDALPLLRAMIRDEFNGRIALLSSFGADAAVTLSLVAKVDPATPVLFLQTGKHFPETLAYVTTLQAQLGLTNILQLTPDDNKLEQIDPDGSLWSTQPNRCCWLRKVAPLDDALEAHGIEAIITGRKRYQTKDRSDMDTIELHDDGLFRINPLADWSAEDIRDYMRREALPPHPLIAHGYRSIGCAPCTRPVKEGEDERAGRWAHTNGLNDSKTECGIHLSSKDTADWNI